MVFSLVFFAVFAGGHQFLGLNGTATWLDQAAELLIAAIPVALLMIAGEFDLSIASVLGMAALTVAYLTGYHGWPLYASVLVALGLAVIVGLFNGIVTTRTGLPSFIVTLGTYFMVGGLSLAIVEGILGTTEVSFAPTGWQAAAFASKLGQFHISIIWALAVVVVATWLLFRSPYGNWILATGGNRESARNAGVPTNRVKICLFVSTAVSAALVGVIQAIEYGGANVGQGTDFIFNTIVAAVIGGTLLQGGYGSPIGVMCGSITYSVINIGIYYTGWNSDWAQVFVGALTLIAVLANNYFRKLAMSR